MTGNMKLTASAVLTFAMLAGCAPDYSPNVYSSDAVQQANKVDRGVVIGYREVAISDDGTVGAVTGGAAGGILGAESASPFVPTALTALGGTVVGGIVGVTVQHATGDTTGWEYIVREPKGDLISVTQRQPKPIPIGQAVLVIEGKQARIVPDYSSVALEQPLLPAAAKSIAGDTKAVAASASVTTASSAVAAPPTIATPSPASTPAAAVASTAAASPSAPEATAPSATTKATSASPESPAQPASAATPSPASTSAAPAATTASAGSQSASQATASSAATKAASASSGSPVQPATAAAPPMTTASAPATGVPTSLVPTSAAAAPAASSTTPTSDPPGPPPAAAPPSAD